MDDQNTSGNGDGHDTSDDNIIRMPTLAERDKMRRETMRLEAEQRKREERAVSSGEQLINLPPATKYLLGAFILIHLGLYVLAPANILQSTILHFGFIPAKFTAILPFDFFALVTPITHMFLHGSWLHIGMNGVMMMAFGTGIERWIGGKRMILFFILCGLCGAAAHFALNIYSMNPVIGASGGLSGFFAAILIMMNRQREAASAHLPSAVSQSKYGLWPFIILWIGISVLFGMMGSPDGNEVAWAAHVGGFLGGFLVLKVMRI